MKKNSSQPIQPSEMLQVFLAELSGLQTTIHTPGEEDFEYLEGDGICIEADNPAGGEALYIDLGEDITLSYGDWQAFYEAEEDDCALALENLRDLLADRLYVVNVFCREDWICSMTMEDTAIRADAVKKEIREFLHTAECDEFIGLIREKGAGIRCQFWTKGKKNLKLRPGEL